MNNKICLFMIFVLLFSVVTIPAYAIPDKDKHKDKEKSVITDKECQKCHSKSDVKKPKIPGGNSAVESNTEYVSNPALYSQNAMSTSGNYTTILEIGQTPYQLGPFFRDGYNGWSWWDNDGFGTDEQKNLILLTILDNSTGTIKPVQGLTTLPTWPQASFRSHGGTYSYKADDDPSPITTQNNYPDGTEILMVKMVDLTGPSSATLNFWTWYSMELDWDYGYVAVSTDGGNNWINLPGTLTTNTNPYGNNLGNGITGSSSGAWVQETMDLTPYVGSKILLGFKFKSDEAVNEEGWYVDDITVEGFSDDAETVEIKTLSANVSYPRLTILNPTDPLTTASTLQYDQYVQTVQLHEVIDHPGTYTGYFKYDPFASQYSGKYTVDLDVTIDGQQITGSTTFDTTIFGCQNCHNKNYAGGETSFAHGGDGGGMQSCAYICHSGSRGLYGDGFMGPPMDANPLHVHEMKFGHQGGFLDGAYYPQPPYNVPSHVTEVGCKDCHTSFIHDNTGSDTAKIGNYTLYGTNITFSSGTHQSLTCEQCHGDLSYPDIPPTQLSITDILGEVNSSTFTSSVSFTDTYAVDVNGLDDLTINIHANDGSTKSISVYVIGPVDNTTTGLQGPCGGNPCYVTQSLSSAIDMTMASPSTGTWLVKLYMLQGGIIDYTITSNYPIERKPIIKIPDCNNCHNSGGTGGAQTDYEIPGWNPGFAHVDTNGDGNLDIQCRMCHDTTHNIRTTTCQNCHTTAPTGHFIKEPNFSEYTVSQCLECHGDPHRVTGGGGSIACHQNDVNISKFGKHANLSTSDGSGVVSDNDCWTCHYNKDMNNNSIYLCQSCHINSTGVVPVNDPALLVPDFAHGDQQCKSCHAPRGYHMDGTVGPKGLMDLFSFG